MHRFLCSMNCLRCVTEHDISDFNNTTDNVTCAINIDTINKCPVSIEQIKHLDVNIYGHCQHRGYTAKGGAVIGGANAEG